MAEMHVLVCTFNIRKGEEIKGKFSEACTELFSQGWSLRGPLQTHTQIDTSVKPHNFWVTLIQDFIKED